MWGTFGDKIGLFSPLHPLVTPTKAVHFPGRFGMYRAVPTSKDQMHGLTFGKTFKNIKRCRYYPVPSGSSCIKGEETEAEPLSCFAKAGEQKRF